MGRRKKMQSHQTGLRSNKISELLGNPKRRSFTSAEISALVKELDLTAANKFRKVSLRSGLSAGEISHYYGSQGGGVTPESLASEFQTRVEADGGTFEAESCLVDRIQHLMDVGMWEKASAVWMPHGKKAEKYYAVKGGAVADFGFSRGSGTRTRKGPSLIETVAADVPALDYTNDTCPALSLEPARTNLLVWSEAFDKGSWSKPSLTVTVNAAAGPENLTTADALLEVAAPATHRSYASIVKAVSSIQYTFSVFLKPIGRDWVYLEIQDGATANGVRCWFNITTGVKGASALFGVSWTLQNYTITPSANGFYRVDVTGTSDTAFVVTCLFALTTGNSTTVGYLGDITKGVYAYGAQLEQASYATSYIPTTTATVSRIADAVTALTGVSSLIGQTEGTLYFEGKVPANGVDKRITLNNAVTNEQRAILQFTTGNKIQYTFIDNNIVQGVITNAGFVTGTKYKIVATWKANKITLTINGVKIGEDLTVTTGTLTLSRVTLDSGSGTLPFYGEKETLLLSTTAISDEEAEIWTTI